MIPRRSWTLIPKALGLLAMSTVLFGVAPRVSQGEENQLAARMVAKALQSELSSMDSPTRALRHDRTRKMMAWLDVGVWRPEWTWTEKTSIKAWVTNTDQLVVGINQLEVIDDRIEFKLRMSIPLKSDVWHRTCEWSETRFSATCVATVDFQGSLAISGGKLSDPKLEKVGATVADLEFDRQFCQTFRSPITSMINQAIRKQEKKLALMLAKQLDGRKLY